MPVEAYINFNGNCREAVEFYVKVFGIEVPKFMTYGDMPPDPGFPITDKTKNLIMHTSLKIKDSMVMFSDVLPDMPLVVGNNISLIVGSKDMDEIKTLFNKMKDGGTVKMDIQETFWSKCYGFLIDKFGIPWQFNLY
ncbi:MAG: glyoxalase/bleomycin resistance/extradiol dioxygenase family protein [Actinobacteria bacterium]|nr:glyoxalase/bleomycin resistance/extradiol dioxygenase family protein [Actinomycetota bacterium]